MKKDIIYVGILIVFFVSIISNFSLAWEPRDVMLEYRESGSETINPDEWKPGDLTLSNNSIEDKVGRILGVIKNFGIIVSVLALMFIGIRTMFGSVHDKSEYKEAMPSFIIGVIILLTCSIIPSIIYDIASSFN